MNENLKFPINTATACQFKWTWSTVFLSTGTSASCHRCKGWDVSEIMDDFHNHPGKIKDRENMLEGQWPGNGCEYCKKIEDAGAESERTAWVNDLPFSPKELIENPKATRVTPRILEVYFNNKCNQKCVYCSPYFSSLIQKEVQKYGPLESTYHLDGFEQRADYNDLKDKFWIWMEKNSQDLREFRILGGEPLYQEEFSEVLDFFRSRHHPFLKVIVFSNLKHRPDKFKDKIAIIEEFIEQKKIKEFNMVCSMDNWGPQAEFARHGMDLVEWEENFNTLLNSKLTITVHSTISPVTLTTMEGLYSRIMEWNKIKEVTYSWNTVANPEFMNPEILGKYAKPYFDKLLDIIPKDNITGSKIIKGFYTQVVNHEVDYNRIQRLSNYLDNIDKRRNTNWRELYPYIPEILKEVENEQL